jgi:hypothetical protein
MVKRVPADIADIVYSWAWEVDVERTINILMVSPTAQGVWHVHISSTKQILSWRKIPITLIMALRWALECNGLIASVDNLPPARCGAAFTRQVARCTLRIYSPLGVFYSDTPSTLTKTSVLRLQSSPVMLRAILIRDSELRQ